MLIRWANPEKTYVIIEVMGNRFQMPASADNPEWLRIEAMIDAGFLVIPSYAPEEETE